MWQSVLLVRRRGNLCMAHRKRMVGSASWTVDVPSFEAKWMQAVRRSSFDDDNDNDDNDDNDDDDDNSTRTIVQASSMA